MANAIITRAEQKYTKTLYTRIEGGNRPVVFGARDATEEAAYVAREIRNLREQGVALHEMAVLFRSGFHSFKLEIELAARQIPFEKRGGLKLTESAHVKDVLSFFRVLSNPRDNLSWNRILLLMEKIGPRTAQKILEAIKTSDEPLTVLREYPAGRSREGLTALADLFESLLDRGLTPAGQFDVLLEYYQPVFERVYHDDYPRRSKDIDQLKTIVSGYDNLEELVADTALEPPEAATDAPVGTDRLVLSTIHSAKGLEWDTVFIINLADGQFPTVHAMPGPQWEEERRLLYVAATRARKRLFCTYPRQVMSQDRRFFTTSLSPFLAEVEGGLYSAARSGAEGERPVLPPPVVVSATGTAGGPLKGAMAVDRLPPGTAVRHPFFGLGRVEAVVGSRSVDVRFDRHGKKTLHLDFARLEVVE